MPVAKLPPGHPRAVVSVGGVQTKNTTEVLVRSEAKNESPDKGPRQVRSTLYKAWTFWLAASLAITASIILVTPNADSEQSDGPKVQLYLEGQDSTQLWQPDMRLPPNTIVHAEIHATKPTQAIATLVNDAGEMLVEAKAALASRIELAAGEIKRLPGGLQLFGPDQNEVLLIHTCPTDIDLQDPKQLAGQVQHPRCQLFRFPLR